MPIALNLQKIQNGLLGAVGFSGVPDHVSLCELLLPIRVGFDQYVYLRTVKLLPGLRSLIKISYLFGQ